MIASDTVTSNPVGFPTAVSLTSTSSVEVVPKPHIYSAKIVHSEKAVSTGTFSNAAVFPRDFIGCTSNEMPHPNTITETEYSSSNSAGSGLRSSDTVPSNNFFSVAVP